MNTYYIIRVIKGDTDLCVENLKKYQGENIDIIFLADEDISQVYRVPFIQKYSGTATVLTDQMILNKKIDIKNILENHDYMHDTSLNIFILNCESSFFKNNFNSLKLATSDLRNYINLFKNPNENLTVYFDVIKHNNEPLIGEIDKPISLHKYDFGWEIPSE